jgi:hypothetical protein
MIVQCIECGKDVSTEATVCPSCGFPQKAPNTSEAGSSKSPQSHIYGWIALIAFFLSNFVPAIISPLIVLVAIVFALLEMRQGGKVMGGIALALCLIQVWAIADHFGGLSASMGLTNAKEIEQQAVRKYETTSTNLPANALQIIEEHCSAEWPDDFKMRRYCQDQQQKGVSTLERGLPSGIGASAFKMIRGKCAGEWPTDFKMRAYCESQQFDAYRSLGGSGRDDKAEARCAQQWPDDYKMRRYCESKQ